MSNAEAELKNIELALFSGNSNQNEEAHKTLREGISSKTLNFPKAYMLALKYELKRGNIGKVSFYIKLASLRLKDNQFFKTLHAGYSDDWNINEARDYLNPFIDNPEFESFQHKEKDSEEDQETADREKFQAKLKEGSDTFKEGNFQQCIDAFSDSSELAKKLKMKIDQKMDDSIKFLSAMAHSSIGTSTSLAMASDIFKSLLGIKSFKEEEVAVAVEAVKMTKPMVLFGAAQHLERCYRFKVGLKMIEGGLTMGESPEEFIWPGFDEVMEYSKISYLQEQFHDLQARFSFPPKPIGVCRFANCLNQPQQTSPSTDIYLEEPDFNGYVELQCFAKCIIKYHFNCWKSTKEIESKQSGLPKFTDKDMLGKSCLTPGCYKIQNGVNEPNKIILILIMDKYGKNKSILRAQPEPETAPPLSASARPQQRKKKKRHQSAEQTAAVAAPPVVVTTPVLAISKTNNPPIVAKSSPARVNRGNVGLAKAGSVEQDDSVVTPANVARKIAEARQKLGDCTLFEAECSEKPKVETLYEKQLWYLSCRDWVNNGGGFLKKDELYTLFQDDQSAFADFKKNIFPSEERKGHISKTEFFNHLLSTGDYGCVDEFVCFTLGMQKAYDQSAADYQELYGKMFKVDFAPSKPRQMPAKVRKLLSMQDSGPTASIPAAHGKLSRTNSESEKGAKSRTTSESEKGSKSRTTSESEKGVKSRTTSETEKGARSRTTSETEKGVKSRSNSMTVDALKSRTATESKNVPQSLMSVAAKPFAMPATAKQSTTNSENLKAAASFFSTEFKSTNGHDAVCSIPKIKEANDVSEKANGSSEIEQTEKQTDSMGLSNGTYLTAEKADQLKLENEKAKQKILKLEKELAEARDKNTAQELQLNDFQHDRHDHTVYIDNLRKEHKEKHKAVVDQLEKSNMSIAREKSANTELKKQLEEIKRDLADKKKKLDGAETSKAAKKRQNETLSAAVQRNLILLQNHWDSVRTIYNGLISEKEQLVFSLCGFLSNDSDPTNHAANQYVTELGTVMEILDATGRRFKDRIGAVKDAAKNPELHWPTLSQIDVPQPPSMPKCIFTEAAVGYIKRYSQVMNSAPSPVAASITPALVTEAVVQVNQVPLEIESQNETIFSLPPPREEQPEESDSEEEGAAALPQRLSGVSRPLLPPSFLMKTTHIPDTSLPPPNYFQRPERVQTPPKSSGASYIRDSTSPASSSSSVSSDFYQLSAAVPTTESPRQASSTRSLLPSNIRQHVNKMKDCKTLTMADAFKRPEAPNIASRPATRVTHNELSQLPESWSFVFTAQKILELSRLIPHASESDYQHAIYWLCARHGPAVVKIMEPDDLKKKACNILTELLMTSTAEEMNFSSGGMNGPEKPNLECSICCDNFRDEGYKRPIHMLYCNHIFHKTCIRNWLETKVDNDGKGTPNSCPLCRDQVEISIQNPEFPPLGHRR